MEHLKFAYFGLAHVFCRIFWSGSCSPWLFTNQPREVNMKSYRVTHPDPPVLAIVILHHYDPRWEIKQQHTEVYVAL